jgi:hypothetical protein
VLPDDVVVAADAVDDQLTLVAGAGISLVANANSDQITIVNTNTSSPSTELFAKSITVDNISIDTNVIQINESNADLIIRANASGSVIAEAGASIYEFDPTGILKVSDEQLFINTNSNNTNRAWYFENKIAGLPTVADGTLTSEFRLPISDDNSVSTIVFPGAGAPTEWGGIAYITEPGGILEDLYANALNIYMVGADVRVTAQTELSTETAKQWTFKTNGQLQFPDGTIQNTAWTGSVFFNVAGDDSTQREVTSGETIKFTGTNGINISTNPEGEVTISGPNLSNYLTEVPDDITVGSIRINTNVIQTVDSNAHLELDANGTGAVIVRGTETATPSALGGAFRVAGASYLGYNASAATPTFFGRGLAQGQPYAAANWNYDSNAAGDGHLVAWYVQALQSVKSPGATFGNVTNTFTLPVNLKQASETFTGLQDATGVVTHNCSNGQVFLHTSPDADWTANLTNLSLSTGYGTTVTLIVEQGGTAYVPNALQIAGASQTITWQGSASAPTGNTNKTDIVSFTILNNSGTYKVYGQLTSFG